MILQTHYTLIVLMFACWCVWSFHTLFHLLAAPKIWSNELTWSTCHNFTNLQWLRHRWLTVVSPRCGHYNIGMILSSLVTVATVLSWNCQSLLWSLHQCHHTVSPRCGQCNSVYTVSCLSLNKSQCKIVMILSVLVMVTTTLSWVSAWLWLLQHSHDSVSPRDGHYNIVMILLVVTATLSWNCQPVLRRSLHQCHCNVSHRFGYCNNGSPHFGLCNNWYCQSSLWSLKHHHNTVNPRYGGPHAEVFNFPKVADLCNFLRENNNNKNGWQKDELN